MSSPVDTLGTVTDDTILDAIDKMEKAVEHVQSQFTTVRTGRASPALVEKLMVDYYGSMVPVQQVTQYDLATVESKLFDVQTKQLVWAATTTTFNPRSVARETPGFASVIIGQLAQRGIIQSK